MSRAVVTAIAAQKGGTGKTALAGSLGSQWGYAGYRTLLIDLDQQAVYIELTHDQIKEAPEFDREKHLADPVHHEETAHYYGRHRRV